MGYGLVITNKAFSQLQRLDVWLQEEVLDELEELADDPPVSPCLRVYRMIRLRGDDVDVIFLRLLIDRARASISLLRRERKAGHGLIGKMIAARKFGERDASSFPFHSVPVLHS